MPYKIDPSLWPKIVDFCVPLQTTSQRVLKEMNRHYSIENVNNIIKDVRKHNNSLHVITQIIYGFPTETFEEFKDYFSLLWVYDVVWFYYYSDRKWTKAENFLGKIWKKDMMKRLILIWKMKQQYGERVCDKNETLQLWLDIFHAREY